MLVVIFCLVWGGLPMSAVYHENTLRFVCIRVQSIQRAYLRRCYGLSSHELIAMIQSVITGQAPTMYYFNTMMLRCSNLHRSRSMHHVGHTPFRLQS